MPMGPMGPTGMGYGQPPPAPGYGPPGYGQAPGGWGQPPPQVWGAPGYYQPYRRTWSTFFWVRLTLVLIALGLSVVGACVSAITH
jgi:hypothetical protein